MSDSRSYTVPGIHCGHCAAAIKEEVSSVEGVEDIDVVTVRGHALRDEALRAAIEEAGYEVAA